MDFMIYLALHRLSRRICRCISAPAAGYAEPTRRLCPLAKVDGHVVSLSKFQVLATSEVRVPPAVVVVVAAAAFDGFDGQEPAAVGVVDTGARLGEGEGSGVFVAALVLAEPAVVVLAGGGVGGGVVGGVGANRQGGGARGWPYGSQR